MCFKKENHNRLKSAKQNESSRLSCKQCEWRQTISNNQWQMPVLTTNPCHTCPLKTASLVWDSLVWYWPLSPLVISRIVFFTINIQVAASGHPRSVCMIPNSQLKSSNTVGSLDWDVSWLTSHRKVVYSTVKQFSRKLVNVTFLNTFLSLCFALMCSKIKWICHNNHLSLIIVYLMLSQPFILPNSQFPPP